MPLLRPLTSLRPLTRRRLLHPQTRTLTGTSRLRLKEDADRTPQQVEQAKQDQMKPGSGWSRDTASKSEEAVGADQEKVEDHGEHMEELQKETARESEKEKGKK